MSDHVEKCLVCGSTAQNHDSELEHGFYLSSEEGEPVALIVNMQRYYDDDYAKSSRLARVYVELATHFPDKTFAFMPSSMMIRNDRASSVILGEAYIRSYIGYEIPTQNKEGRGVL